MGVGSGVACSTMFGGDAAKWSRVCSTSIGGGPADEESVWAAARVSGLAWLCRRRRRRTVVDFVEGKW